MGKTALQAGGNMSESDFERRQKGVERNYEASGRLISHGWDLVQKQRADVGFGRSWCDL